jgi:hypothetical protein
MQINLVDNALKGRKTPKADNGTFTIEKDRTNRPAGAPVVLKQENGCTMHQRGPMVEIFRDEPLEVYAGPVTTTSLHVGARLINRELAEVSWKELIKGVVIGKLSFLAPSNKPLTRKPNSSGGRI